MKYKCKWSILYCWSVLGIHLQNVWNRFGIQHLEHALCVVEINLFKYLGRNNRDVKTVKCL